MTDAAGLREQRRREKDRVSREHLLDAAEHVFGNKGFHEATLKEVAERAEFSVGAIYGFFDNLRVAGGIAIINKVRSYPAIGYACDPIAIAIIAEDSCAIINAYQPIL